MVGCRRGFCYDLGHQITDHDTQYRIAAPHLGQTCLGEADIMTNTRTWTSRVLSAAMIGGLSGCYLIPLIVEQQAQDERRQQEAKQKAADEQRAAQEMQREDAVRAEKRQAIFARVTTFRGELHAGRELAKNAIGLANEVQNWKALIDDGGERERGWVRPMEELAQECAGYLLHALSASPSLPVFEVLRGLPSTPGVSHKVVQACGVVRPLVARAEVLPFLEACDLRAEGQTVQPS